MPSFVAAALGGLLSLTLAGTAMAQERFSLFVGSATENVMRMVKLADLRDDDVVVDLGSGDGRIVFAAAASNAKLRGWGVDIDAALVTRSNETAKEQGLANRVHFLHQNAFDADLSKSTVIFMWLWPELKRMLRPKILAEARPVTRVVTSTWDLGSWRPDEVDGEGTPVSMWIVPAKVEGNWNWSLPFGDRQASYAAVVEQRFQNAEGVVRVGARRGIFDNVRLRGEDISFTLAMTLDGAGFVRHEFVGKVQGDVIEGSVRISPSPHDKTVVLAWRATRTRDSAYFAPAGLIVPEK